MIDSVYSFISFSLVGLIWTIQVVHYPSFSYVDNDQYIDFQHFHMRAITYVVMPLMLFELAFEIYRLIFQYELLSLLTFSLVIFIWLWTFFVNVPFHNKLSMKKDNEVIKSLVLSNWPRTIAWSIKSILIIFQ